MRSKADRERDIHAAVRTSTAQQAVRMLLSAVKQHGVQQVFNALDACAVTFASARKRIFLASRAAPALAAIQPMMRI